MSYRVQFHPAFIAEWKLLPMALKELVGEVLDHLEDDGPFLGRPEVDTLSGSSHANMKEIRSSTEDRSGGLPSPSTRAKVPSFCAAERNKAEASSYFIGS